MSIVQANVARAIELLARQTSLIRPGQRPDGIAADLRTRLRHYWPTDGIESPACAARYPDRARTVAMAREVVQGHIRFWHPWHMEQTHRPEPLGRPIRWNARPNGDEEWPHALVRFSHMMDLAIASRLTDDGAFLDTYRRHLHEFFAARLASNDLWLNRLDAALRVGHLIRSYDVVRADSRLQATDHLVLAALVLLDAPELARGLGTRHGNWEFFMATALACAADFFADVADTVAWRQQATRRLGELLTQEIAPDGTLLEQVPMYHGQCALALLDRLVMQRAAASEEGDGDVVHTIHRMVEVLTRTADPEGRIPVIGDSDAFEVDYIVRYRDAVIGPPRRDQGPLASRRPVGPLDTLTDTGWIVARWQGSGTPDGYLLFDASGRPAATRYGHSHADDLQILVHTGGRPLLVDPGRFTYESLFLAEGRWLPWRIRHSTPFRTLYAAMRPRFRGFVERDWRQYFRRTAQHNTVTCNGDNQPGYDGPDSGVPATVTRHAPRQEGEYVTCAATAAYTHYTHRRDLIGLWPHLLIVVDRLDAPTPCTWTASFHLGAGLVAECADAATVGAVAPGGAEHLLAFVEAAGMPVAVAVEDDWVSPTYNVKEPSRTVRATVTARATATLVSAISLEPGAPAAPASLAIRRLGPAEPGKRANLAVTMHSGPQRITAYLRLNHDPIRDGGVESDAFVTVVSESAAGSAVWRGFGHA